MTYQCQCCGAIFYEPHMIHYREDMNGEGAMQDFYVSVCPSCGEEQIEEYESEDTL